MLKVAVIIGMMSAMWGHAALAQEQRLTQEQNMAQEEVFLAGGCFWCMEAAFDHYGGVKSAVSGYMGGEMKTPTYEAVSSGDSGHIEVVRVTFDPAILSFEKLLDIFWENVDPLDAGGQFADRGSQYITAIFPVNETQHEVALSSKQAVETRLGEDVATKIIAASSFYEAEEYHQDYHLKNPLRYKAYKYGSGRPARLKEVWGK